jgi:hypothetical protein
VVGAMRAFDQNISINRCLSEIARAKICRVPDEFKADGDPEQYKYEKGDNRCADYVMNLLEFVDTKQYARELKARQDANEVAVRRLKALYPLFAIALLFVMGAFVM